jgi:hypothetical protein
MRVGNLNRVLCLRKALCIIICSSVASIGLVASPVQHPKRSINSCIVDLNPLFKWWSKHEGPRPLSAWVHITGSVVGTNALGWIVEARVEGASARGGAEEGKSTAASSQTPLKILLQRPPVEDLAEFEQLSSRLSALNAQRANIAGEEAQARTRDQAVVEQQHAAGRNRVRSRLLALEDKQLKQSENGAKTEGKSLDDQIKEIKAKLAIYPSNDHYEVDCFALDLQNNYGRLPVYDHGWVVK